MTNMSSRSGDLINRALRKSFSTTCKRAKISTIDDCIAACARRVLSNKIEFEPCPQFSTEEFLKSLKTRYIALTPSNKPKKKKKKKNKLLKSESSRINPSPMKNTELNGQNLSLPTPKYTLFPPDDVQLGWKGPVPVGCGFVNLGTTCYINSTLQALFHVPSFVNWLKEDKKHEASCEKMNGMFHSECIVCAMAKTLQISHRNSNGSWKPKYIIEKIKTICKHLSPFRQEDAHEFLRYLMEAMEKSYTTALGMPSKKLDSYSKETTPLNQIFGGYIRTEVTCLECSHVSTTFQHFQDLILDIRQSGITNVYDALESYFSKERLDGDESYHCEHCKKKVSAYKKFSIERAPNVLCIQLKRFNINSYYGGSKISKPVNTPQCLDLSKFKHKKGSSNGTPLKYRVVSMVFHHGPSVNSGHYTALGCTSSGSYYYFNDEQSFPVNFGAYANNANTYIMFYEREKTSLINENSVNVKSASSCSSTAIPLSNGCANGAVPARTNGFFTKRENPFLPASGHPLKYPAVAKDTVASVSKEADSQKPSSYRQLSWEPVENKENEPKQSQTQTQPTKALVIVPAAPAPIVKSNASSLVPYTQSSDSENSDAEGEKDDTDTNNNSRLTSEVDDNNSIASTSTLSPLAKRNSTLTSLLTSSPKNENSAYRGATSSPRPPFTNGKPGKSVEEKKSASLHPKLGGRMISFSLFCREKKHNSRNYENETKNSGSNHCNEQNAKESDSESRRVDDSRRLNGKGDETTYVSSYFSESRENGLTNGTGKTNGMVNGVNGCERAKPATNGWIVTEMQEDECSTNRTEKSSKIPNNCDWVVVEKENTKLSPRDSAKFKDTRKCNGNDNYSESSSSQQDNQNASRYNYSYSSQNGYGGKVNTWNGEISRINRESKEERKETLKRNYNYDDEIDRGKVKKTKYYSRNENGSSNSPMPRKNPIQQRQNQYNSMNGNGNGMNKNNNMSNHRNDKRWQFSQNGFNYPPRRHNSHNPHFRHHNQNYQPHHRPGGFSQQNSWARR